MFLVQSFHISLCVDVGKFCVHSYVMSKSHCVDAFDLLLLCFIIILSHHAECINHCFSLSSFVTCGLLLSSGRL